MIFPPNNLPTASKNWAREVEKKVTNLESSFRSAEVNNTTRDSQLSVTANSALAAATQAAAAAAEANEALSGLLSLGADGSSYDINAGNISGGTITGVNFNTTGASESLTLSGGKVNFFEAGSGIGSMSADTDGSNDYIQISSNSAQGQLTVGSDYSVLAGLNSAVQVGAFGDGRIDLTGGLVFCNADLKMGGAIEKDSGTLYVERTGIGGLSTPITTNINGTPRSEVTQVWSQGNSVEQSIDINAWDNGDVQLKGDNIWLIARTGYIGANAQIAATALTSGGAITRSQLANDGLGLTGASITAGGNFVRTSSSARYKQDIEDLNVPYESILNLQPKTFRRKDEVSKLGDKAKVYPGFIAEDIADTDLDMFAFYKIDDDGNKVPEGVHYPELTAALVSALKHQDSLIKSLTARIEALESK